MGTETKIEVCVFCGEVAETRDHVPPQGVFPDPKPTDLISVPACNDCNCDTKLDDEYFRWLVATGSAESEDALRLIKERILPKFRRRPALLIQIMQGATRIDVKSEGGIYLGRKPAFYFERARIQTVISKTVRGLYFHETGCILSQKATVQDFVLNPIFKNEFKEVICSLPLRDIGEGGVFSYRYWVDNEEPRESFWFLMFFNRTLFFTKTRPNTLLNRAPATTGGAG
jgi:hypothetical protein